MRRQRQMNIVGLEGLEVTAKGYRVSFGGGDENFLKLIEVTVT